MTRQALLVLLTMVTACSAPPPAPVIEQSSSLSASRLEQDGQYRVRRGDTLHAIAFHYGLDHRDIALWNGIARPYLIYPDQLLRMTPPKTGKARVATRSSQEAPTRATNTTKPPAPPGKVTPAKTAATLQKPALPATDPNAWVWPVEGRVVRHYLPNDPSRNGLDIAGIQGQEVRAAAAGTVVYSGNGLIAYGELIIIKHSERMLSAYAHNRVRLVTEGAQIRSGQKIAEMGKNDRNENILHFEIRVNGRPVDPRKYLPPK